MISEVDIPVEPTSTATTPRYVDTKPRKTLSKEKPKKYKHLKKKEPMDMEEEATTVIAYPESKTHLPTQTSMPMLKKQPQWIYRSDANGVLVGWGVVVVVVLGVICSQIITY